MPDRGTANIETEETHLGVFVPCAIEFCRKSSERAGGVGRASALRTGVSELGAWTSSCESVVLQLEPASQSPGGLFRTHMAGPTLRDSDPVGLGWGLRVCISNEFPDAAAAGPGTTL